MDKQIRNNRRHGDDALIAQFTGYSADYVRKVREGRRYNAVIAYWITQLPKQINSLAERINQEAKNYAQL